MVASPARALSDLLRREERFEQMCLGLPVHAGPVVADGQQHIISREKAGMFAAVGLVQYFICRFNGQLPSVWHRVTRIDGQVIHNLVQLGWIEFNFP